MRSPKKSVLQALGAATLFGASAPLAKALLKDLDPVILAALLYLGSGLCAVSILFLRYRLGRRRAPRTEARLGIADIPWLITAVLAGGIAAPIVLLLGLRTTPAATASLLLNFEVVATTLIAALVFREAVGSRVWAAVILITSAGVLLSLHSYDAWGLSVGALGVVAACVLWGLDNNLTKKISAKDPLEIVAIKGLMAGSFTLLLGTSLGLALPPLQAAVLAMLLGAASYGFSIAFFVWALRGMGVARTGALFGTAPFIGVLLSFIVFPEVPSALFLASLAAMMAGTLLILGEAHQHAHEHVELQHDHRHAHDDDHHAHTHGVGDLPHGGEHSHPHQHDAVTHSHAHAPDLHHEHNHD